MILYSILLDFILISTLILDSTAGPIFRDAAQCERVLFRTGQFIKKNWADFKSRYELPHDESETNKDKENVNIYKTSALNRQTNPPKDDIKLEVIVNRIHQNLVDILRQRGAYDKNLMKMFLDVKTSASDTQLETDVDEDENIMEDIDLMARLAEYDPKLVSCLGLKKL